MAKPALGRGLGALLGSQPPQPKEATAPAAVHPAANQPDPGSNANLSGVVQVPIQQVRPCAFQPRKEFSEDALEELAESIAQQGIVQPLIVRPQETGYEIIAGERRWRAAQRAGLDHVPVIVRQADDRAVLELALIENLQREDLNPLEEARGYAQLSEQFHLKQEEIAARVGKNRATVANALRLLKLEAPVQEHLRDGRLSVGHAKVLLALHDSNQQVRAAQQVIHDGLNVRQTEELVAAKNRPPSPSTAPADASSPPLPAARDPHVARLESRLQETLGTKVGLRYQQGKGSIEIRFYNDQDLERIVGLLNVSAD